MLLTQRDDDYSGWVRSCRVRVQSAFTLIELLVVISIIAILAAILFPVFAHARAKARQATCLSNLKQLGLATFLYAQDYDEKVFLDGYSNADGQSYFYWAAFIMPSGDCDMNRGLINPYIKSAGLFECPSSKSLTWWNTPIRLQLTYGLNVVYMYQPRYAGDPTAPGWWSPQSDPITLSRVQSPADTLLIGDSAFLYHGNVYRSSNFSPPSWEFTSLYAPHQKMTDVLWFDGHVKPSPLSTPAPDLQGNTIEQRKAANMGVILKFPYTGNGRIDDYYYMLDKPSN